MAFPQDGGGTGDKRRIMSKGFGGTKGETIEIRGHYEGEEMKKRNEKRGHPYEIEHGKAMNRVHTIISPLSTNRDRA